MIPSHSMRLGKKNSTNLEQLDYVQDLNRLLFSNVVDQADQKTEYYLTALIVFIKKLWTLTNFFKFPSSY